MIADEKVFTVKEAARSLRLSVASIYALCAVKKLRHQRVGVGRGKILIPADSIQEYLAKGTVEPAGVSPPPRGTRVKSFGHLDSDRLLAAWKAQGVKSV
ncbi:helix-turn-helix domain-containing protein [Limnoglobus roseus]|uniref:DNA-binding protein n=1 Tax=Limnoglobus roseus TaxID=2598579 RepID=A0A5C1AH94_9BACT|nr:helix-turn-helix domain-containing protein [Limnoglobus roseus]QEL18591.1 DNA-binding protein [Limnoglobus roseus]